MNNKNIEISKDNQVGFSLNENDFADLILNFLGKKEKNIYYKNDINFKIYKNDIEQFYYLLEAKINKEIYISINHFSLTVFYSDDTQREINGIKALNEFLETRDVLPTAIILSWNILLTFPNSTTVENQKIDVVYSILEDTNFINISIEHTNQVWGQEVLNLLKECHKSLILEKHQIVSLSEFIMKLLKTSFAQTAVILTIFIFAIIILPDRTTLNKHQVESMSEIIEVGKEKNPMEVQLSFNMIKGKYSDNDEFIKIIKNNKIRDILETQIKENKKESEHQSDKWLSVVFGLFLIVTVILFMLQKNIQYFSEKSFILITTRAEKSYAKYQKSKGKLEYYSLTSLFFTIVIGLIVNALYQFMS